MSKKVKKRLLTLLFVIFNVVVVYIIAQRTFVNDSEVTINTIFKLWSKNWIYILAVMLLPVAALLFEGVKYYLMIYHVTGERRFFLSIKTAILGKYYDNITPLGSGGQPFQVYYLYKNGIPAGVAGSLPVSAFSMMQIAFSSIALVVFIFLGHYIESDAIRIAAYIGNVFAIFIPLAVVTFSLMPKVTGKIIYNILILLKKLRIVKNPYGIMQNTLKFLQNFKESLAMLVSSRRLVLYTFILSLLYQSALFSIPYFVVRATGVNVSFIELYALCVFIYCAVAFIPTPGNSGGAEVSFAVVFSMLSGGLLFWGMLLWRFSSYFFVILIGLITVFIDAFVRNNPLIIEDD